MRGLKNNYNATVKACFTGYITQAIINNFAPLLFLTFNRTYGIPLEQITLLVTFNFGSQLIVDILAAYFVDKIGYRVSMVIAHLSSALGLLSLAFLPSLLPSPFAGLLISVLLYAVGGGLLEVLVSPVMEACPTKDKGSAMSLLHSFYCWGHVGVVLLSTAFFTVFGIDNWKILAVIWAVVPLANMVVFTRVPIGRLMEEGDRGLGIKGLFREKLFWILMLLMVCAGSCEQAVSQWASTFAEKGLMVSKTVGDLAGPMLFAIAMGTARAVYGKLGEKLPLKKSMYFCGGLCLASYLIISLSGNAVIGLIGCGICGFSVGIMWPGTFTMSASALPRGGTAMFALLALGGDLGCMAGPTFVGFVSSASGNDLKKGILCAVIFPLLLILGLVLKGRNGRKNPVGEAA